MSGPSQMRSARRFSEPKERLEDCPRGAYMMLALRIFKPRNSLHTMAKRDIDYYKRTLAKRLATLEHHSRAREKAVRSICKSVRTTLNEEERPLEFSHQL